MAEVVSATMLVDIVRSMLKRLDEVLGHPGGLPLMRQRLNVDLHLRPNLPGSVVHRCYMDAVDLGRLPETSLLDEVPDGTHPVLFGLAGDPENPLLRVDLDPHARPYSEPLMEVLEHHLLDEH